MLTGVPRSERSGRVGQSDPVVDGFVSKQPPPVARRFLTFGPSGGPPERRSGQRVRTLLVGRRSVLGSFNGLAASDDGRQFQKHADTPVDSFGDDKHSILTPTLLRNADGSLLRENGQLRMWFSATDFSGGSGLHTLHESFSDDGFNWSRPSEPLLNDAHAPTIRTVVRDSASLERRHGGGPRYSTARSPHRATRR